MRIKYLLLHKPLALPGQGTGNKWSATGTDGRQNGIVKSITESAKGYLLEIAVGPHKGIYEIMADAVQFACLEHAAPATEYAEGDTTVAATKPQRNAKPTKA